MCWNSDFRLKDSSNSTWYQLIDTMVTSNNMIWGHCVVELYNTDKQLNLNLWISAGKNVTFQLRKQWFPLCISWSVLQCHDMSVCNVNKHGFNGAFGDCNCFTLTIWSILCMEFIQYTFCIHFQLLMYVQFSFFRATNY